MLSFIYVSQLIIHYSLKMNQSFHNLKKNLKKQFVKMTQKNTLEMETPHVNFPHMPKSSQTHF